MNLEGRVGSSSRIPQKLSSTFLRGISQEGSQFTVNALHRMLCPEILPAVQTWPIILVSIFLCLSLKSGFLGHTSLLASNVSPRARGWRFYSAFPLQLSVVIVQSLHHLNSVRSLCRAKYSNNKQTSPGFLAFILLSKEKTEKAIVSLSTHGRSHVSHKWVTCAGKSLLALID